MFARLDPEEFQASFLDGVQAVLTVPGGPGVPSDGKTVRGSHDRAAIPRVSAKRLVLGQVKVDEKANEMTAIPVLLRLLALKGWIGTLDAMGGQSEISGLIAAQPADSVWGLKGNQGTRPEKVESYCAAADRPGRWPSRSRSPLPPAG